MTIDQGVEMGRPSRLTVTCDVASGALERLQVAGSVVKVAEGTRHRPTRLTPAPSHPGAR